MPLPIRSEEHTSELQSHDNLVCRLLLEKKKHTRLSRLRARDPAPPPPVSGTGRLPRPPLAGRGQAGRAQKPPSPRGLVVIFFLNVPTPPESSTLPHPQAFPI